MPLVRYSIFCLSISFGLGCAAHAVSDTSARSEPATGAGEKPLDPSTSPTSGAIVRVVCEKKEKFLAPIAVKSDEAPTGWKFSCQEGDLQVSQVCSAEHLRYGWLLTAAHCTKRLGNIEVDDPYRYFFAHGVLPFELGDNWRDVRLRPWLTLHGKNDEIYSVSDPLYFEHESDDFFSLPHQERSWLEAKAGQTQDPKLKALGQRLESRFQTDALSLLQRALGAAAFDLALIKIPEESNAVSSSTKKFLESIDWDAISIGAVSSSEIQMVGYGLVDQNREGRRLLRSHPWKLLDATSELFGAIEKGQIVLADALMHESKLCPGDSGGPWSQNMSHNSKILVSLTSKPLPIPLSKLSSEGFGFRSDAELKWLISNFDLKLSETRACLPVDICRVRVLSVGPNLCAREQWLRSAFAQLATQSESSLPNLDRLFQCAVKPEPFCAASSVISPPTAVACKNKPVTTEVSPTDPLTSIEQYLMSQAEESDVRIDFLGCDR